MTSRRTFLASLAAALVLDPERALWVPGKKLISVPAPGLIVEDITQRALRVLQSKIVFAWQAQRDYNQLFTMRGDLIRLAPLRKA